MGFLDRAKKLAEQAKEAAEQAKKLAEQAAGRAGDALADAANRPPPDSTAPTPAGPARPTAAPGTPEYGTAYVPGMLHRPAWRERGLTDPAGLLPIQMRDHAGVPHSTKSQILEEPFGMGRRWTSGERSTGLFYQLYPEHHAWEPPGGKTAFPDVYGASAATLADGRTLVFLGRGDQSVVLEIAGLDDSDRAILARTVFERLASA